MKCEELKVMEVTLTKCFGDLTKMNEFLCISPQIDDIPRLPVNTENYKFNDWDIVYDKSHILKSMCTNNQKCIKDDPGCCELCLLVFYEMSHFLCNI